MQERVDAYRDQELARLFHESGWTQERIAEKVGKDRSYIARLLIFGRFLDFVPTGHNGGKPALSSPKNLTERKFRSAWEQTEASGKYVLLLM